VKQAQTRTNDPKRFPGFGPFQLHPRRHFFGGTLKENQIVWGESCVGRRHFDCVGLVNFCYEEHTRKVGGWAFEIKQYLNGVIGTIDNGKLAPSKVLDGDIVARVGPPNHIGLLAHVGGKVLVIQAPDTVTGLTGTEVYDPAKWDKCVRVRDRDLVPRKHLLKDGNGK
jgi:hypothetical protein